MFNVSPKSNEPFRLDSKKNLHFVFDHTHLKVIVNKSFKTIYKKNVYAYYNSTS